MENAPTNIKEQFEAIRPRYPELAGKVAIVTGSNRGIGKGIATRLAREGMKLVITGLEQAETEAVAAELNRLEVAALPFCGDLGQSENVQQLFAETLAAFGKLDLLVNNAASLIRRTLFEGGEELLEKQLASNIRNPYLCAYNAARIMREQGGGNIISLSSVGGVQAHWEGLPYDITKGAVDAMTRAMALELADYGIRVNAIAPGAIRPEKLPLSTGTESVVIHEQVKRKPLSCFGVAQDIAAAVAFLAYTDASYITGQIIYVDGGLTAQLTPGARTFDL